MGNMRLCQSFLLLLSIATSGIAQSNGTNTNTTCQRDYALDVTTSLPLRFLYSGDERNWIFTSGLYEGSFPSLGRTLNRAAFISVPEVPTGYEGRTLRTCIYQGPPMNVSWTNAPDNATVSCEGILSQNCTEALKSGATRPVSASIDDCVLSIQALNEIRDACGWTPPSSLLFNLTQPSNACTVPSSQLSAPENYTTYDAFNGGDRYISDEYYELAGRQIVPWILGASWNQVGNSAFSGDQGSAVVCIAPSGITQGNENAFPPGDESSPDDEGAGAVLSARRAWLGTVSIAGLVGLVLM